MDHVRAVTSPEIECKIRGLRLLMRGSRLVSGWGRSHGRGGSMRGRKVAVDLAAMAVFALVAAACGNTNSTQPTAQGTTGICGTGGASSTPTPSGIAKLPGAS